MCVYVCVRVCVCVFVCVCACVRVESMFKRKAHKKARNRPVAHFFLFSAYLSTGSRE